ncbi:Predicted pyrophosphatase or phosphodiesterase, AlkP superfamily [Pricia antarctica]|uniref:Predicted pyrophosphatase or phosphodiesterase, AlkP superfamily n=1 Tax=Pricia antarctica TaxID=641691 RepID=A0A1G7GU71_9FLAO|nr:alkaline phosphatase PafA [Pricia antarctica]SDE91702.1 Predicted pyrophosphatase or phosphodiesterase, AlkP superfamily [Pricia antarctica]
MTRRVLILCLTVASIVFSTSQGFGQQKSKAADDHLRTNPKLVVGIIVDQMRYDYITRFYHRFGDDGFKRLVDKGFNCKNNHYNYAPTTTGPGHTSVYTGTTPATHGVIANDWYDKTTGEDVYCAGDDRYESVGTDSDAGKMSPHRNTVTTITDQLRLATQMRGKTISVAMKDRGAVMPGGHTANAAYWFQGKNEGKFITSSYYMSKLPKWVDDFNVSAASKYKKPWTTLKPIDSYLESGSDKNNYEGLFDGENTSEFPHDLPKLWDANGQFDMIKATPFGNSLTADFAIAALDGEKLGADDIPDFLAVSFSSTDYVGHKYGVNSKEVQDVYMRLDEDLARLFKALDKKVGQGEYTVFLTADHAGMDNAAYLKDSKIPAGNVKWNDNKPKFDEFLKYTFGTTDVVKVFSNYQFFLDQEVVKNLDMSAKEVQEAIANEVLTYDGVEHVYTAYQMWQNEYTHGIPHLIQNGYHQKRSGDVIVVLKPDYVSYGSTGSTHGSPYSYDTHTPLLFYGMGIQKGSTVARTEIPDIAATIAALLGIEFPSGETGNPIIEVLEPSHK